jgi:hypothetical protein
VVVRTPGIQSVVRRPTLVLASDCIARTARQQQDGATPGWPRGIVMGLTMQRGGRGGAAGGLWGWPYLASSAAAMSGPRGRRVDAQEWAAVRTNGCVRLAVDTASGGGDGCHFFLRLTGTSCVQTLWTRRRCLVAGRADLSASRRPSSSALCMPSTAPVGPRCAHSTRAHRALQQEDRFVRTAHHGSLRLGVCMTIVLRSKRNNGCFRLPSNESRHRTHGGDRRI